MRGFRRNLRLPGYAFDANHYAALVQHVRTRMDEFKMMYNLLTEVKAISKKVAGKTLEMGKKALTVFKASNQSWTFGQYDQAVQQVTKCLHALRKGMLQMETAAAKTDYWTPDVYYAPELKPLPAPTGREVDGLRQLAMKRSSAWKTYWQYLSAIGLNFEEAQKFWLLAAMGEAFKDLQRVLHAHGEASLEELRAEYLSSCYYIGSLLEDLWQFTDPKGVGAGQMPEWMAEAYAKHTAEQIRKRKPLPPLGERMGAIAKFAEKHRITGSSPPPAPPKVLVDFMARNP